VKKVVLAGAVSLAVVVVIAASLAMSKTDLRVGYVAGTLALIIAGAVVASRWLNPAIAVLVVSLPVVVLYWAGVMPELPATWPTMVLWIAAAVAGALVIRRGTRRAIGFVIVLAVSAVSVWYVRSGIPRAITSSLLRAGNAPAPSFVIRTLNGASVTNATLAGRVVVIDFFATWCIPCRAELPELARLRGELANRSDVVFLFVANDSGGDTRDKVRQFAFRQPAGLSFAWDGGGTAHKAFGFTGVPAMIVLDRAGRVRIHREGYNPAESEFRSILRERILKLAG
jgi:thiol-disulfide isomerase/thioredoxin